MLGVNGVHDLSHVLIVAYSSRSQTLLKLGHEHIRATVWTAMTSAPT